MSVPAKLSIGVIGGGMISQIAHLPFYLQNPRVELVALSETRPSLVRHLKAHFGLANIVADYREVLENPDISTVLIVAPRPVTAPLVQEALEAGKNVITEKPMAHTVDQARKQISAARKPKCSLLHWLHETLRYRRSGRETAGRRPD